MGADETVHDPDSEQPEAAPAQISPTSSESYLDEVFGVDLPVADQILTREAGNSTGLTLKGEATEPASPQPEEQR